MAVVAIGGQSSICSKDVHLQVCILISSPMKQLFFTATNILPVKTTLVTLRNWGCLPLNYLILSLYDRYLWTKLGSKVYILLLDSFNSFIKFHAKVCKHCQNINKSHRGGGYFLCLPCMLRSNNNWSSLNSADTESIWCHCQ